MGSFVLLFRVPLFASGDKYICVTGGVFDGKSYAGRLYIKYKCSRARSELKCLLANRCERCISSRYDADDDIYFHIDWRQWKIIYSLIDVVLNSSTKFCQSCRCAMCV